MTDHDHEIIIDRLHRVLKELADEKQVNRVCIYELMVAYTEIARIEAIKTGKISELDAAIIERVNKQKGKLVSMAQVFLNKSIFDSS